MERNHRKRANESEKECENKEQKTKKLKQKPNYVRK